MFGDGNAYGHRHIQLIALCRGRELDNIVLEFAIGDYRNHFGGLKVSFEKF
ncbi:hypothetical protein MM2B1231_0699 [Mycobacteroides abscessus subsp. bolletii 2B-1231]|nr:hypothetical protein MM2B0626_0639 [Mycobacteroides abscessus subsp. bolletii 2B-0626]EIV16795.1 hypothetical protein MM2B0912R_1039 [Mycobacteroides abscessus subsp. bolletii 2B-0912-R]EIV28580.1 hypothetical protein MM2B0912S_0639 [Mycobacteroides abscessus subsp. bolletii 2B-0912-S]EIV74618.1 hypothetical protein MM2B0107_4844 [Mycobacteroides abscessus subsp. bolletii 2B-0107]EIV82737.1 hypothetical protein MM2B1231_0699 [Mycobacteroides abscessus subsp. bolletii 2B-1231]ETZ80375.1 hypo